MAVIPHCWGLIKQGLHFIADVPDNLHLWLEAFQMRIPKDKAGVRGRKHIHSQPNKPSMSIKQYADSLKTTQWKYLTVRQLSGGKKLEAWFHAREVYILNPLTGKRQLITLLIREDKDGTIKYSYCNCPGCKLKELAYRQSKRYFVEKAFREGKKELGLNQYQTRSEESWNKHMAMIMLAQLFLNQEKIYHYEQSKLWLTTQDVILSLKCILHFVIKTIDDFVNDILLKQPTGKRSRYKLMHLII